MRRRDAERRRSLIISRLRLATVLPAAAGLVWILSEGATPLRVGITAVLFFAFAALVVWHARVEERAAWFEALRLVNRRAIARIERDWAELPRFEPPQDVDQTTHAFAADLDLFGRASLAQWLGPAATAYGRHTLIEWLLHPAPRAVILDRQEAVSALAIAAAWREHLAARGVLGGDSAAAGVERFLSWAEGPPAFVRHGAIVHAAVLALTATIWILLAAWLTGTIDGGYLFAVVLAGIVLSFALGPCVAAAFDRAGSGEQALGGYAALFEHATSAPVTGRCLQAIGARLRTAGAPAAACMRRLNAILGFSELRRTAAILHFPVQALTLWDFHVLFALDRWREASGPHVRGWLQGLGELDALCLFGAVCYENPAWCVPEVMAAPQIEAEGIGHPLIPDNRRVGNDVTIGPPGTLLLVTGSNMSGKSTLLRAIGLNLVLAQAGAAVCASRFRTPEVDLQTSIRVQDSLELGLSYFMAALARLKGVVDAAEHEREGRVLVYLLDEILQGTNSAERGIAVRAVARHLLDAGAIGAMTTHDLALASEEPLATAARLVHFTETVDADGSMRFDYRLRPGLATSRNALRLMQMIGISVT